MRMREWRMQHAARRMQRAKHQMQNATRRMQRAMIRMQQAKHLIRCGTRAKGNMGRLPGSNGAQTARRTRRRRASHLPEVKSRRRRRIARKRRHSTHKRARVCVRLSRFLRARACARACACVPGMERCSMRTSLCTAAVDPEPQNSTCACASSATVQHATDMQRTAPPPPPPRTHARARISGRARLTRRVCLFVCPPALFSRSCGRRQRGGGGGGGAPGPSPCSRRPTGARDRAPRRGSTTSAALRSAALSVSVPPRPTEPPGRVAHVRESQREYSCDSQGSVWCVGGGGGICLCRMSWYACLRRQARLDLLCSPAQSDSCSLRVSQPARYPTHELPTASPATRRGSLHGAVTTRHGSTQRRNKTT